MQVEVKTLVPQLLHHDHTYAVLVKYKRGHSSVWYRSLEATLEHFLTFVIS